MGYLVLTRKPGQSIFIGDDIEIVFIGQGKFSGQGKIGISAPEIHNICRSELKNPNRYKERLKLKKKSD